MFKLMGKKVITNYHSYNNDEKLGQSVLEKRGLIVYLAALIKGAILHTHPYFII